MRWHLHGAAVGLVATLGWWMATQARPSGQASGTPLTVAAQTADTVRRWDGTVNAMARAGQLRLRETRSDDLIPGRTHERFDQLHRGVRVWGGDITRQIDRGMTVSLFGTLYEDLTLDVEPVLSPEEARDIVSGLAGGVDLGSRIPELVVLPLDGGGYALAFRCQAVTAAEASTYFIDAIDGRVRLKQTLFQSQATVVTGSGVLRDTKKVSVRAQAGTFVADDQLRPPSLRTFDLRGNFTAAINALNGVTTLGTGDLASEPGTAWTDGANVDAHTYEGYTYDFYFKRFNRHGFDNADNRIVGLTHTVRLQDVQSAPASIFGQFYINAFYCPQCGSDARGMMVYGEGLPDNLRLIVGSTLVGVKNFAGALDIVAHELTHGVTAFTSRLGGGNEPGALNEAFSDIMGTSVEFFIQPAGNGPQRADYLMGEDIFTSTVPGLVRSLQDPQSLGTPDHYSRRLLDAGDNGEVHANSTIASHAFYLAIEGGTNRTSGLAVQGVGGSNRDQIEKVFYRGFVSLLPSNATFSVARAATIQSARDLYGTGSAAERAVTQAWTAVGVN
jgi:Zn-dependent metalloprotease